MRKMCVCVCEGDVCVREMCGGCVCLREMCGERQHTSHQSPCSLSLISVPIILSNVIVCWSN